MQITFTIPDEYIPRIQNAFQKGHAQSPREAIIKFVKDTVQEFEFGEAVETARQNIVIEKDLIE